MLPAYVMPNALNFQPIQNALSEVAASAQKNRQLDMEQERLGLEKQRTASQLEAAKLEHEKNLARHYGGLAQQWLSEPDAVKQADMFERVFTADPRFKKMLEQHLPKDVHGDPIVVGRTLSAFAKGYQDPLDEKAKLAHIAQSQGATAKDYSQAELNRAQAKAAGQKDAFDEWILGQARAATGAPTAAPQQQAPAAGQPPLRRQSDSGAPMTPIPMNALSQQGADPNLIRVAEPAAGPQAPSEPIVNLPLIGKVPESTGRNIAAAAAYRGKGPFGEMLMKELDRDKLGKEAQNENDKRELKAVEALGRVKQIAAGFKPEWLTYDNAFKQYGVSILDSFETTRKRLPPALLKQHAEYTMFMRDAVSNLTEGIKDATGAAVGVQEEKRIRLGLPDPQKDNPTAFLAKLTASARELTYLTARTRYLRENGFRGQPWNGDGNGAEKTLPLDSFKRIIDQDGDAMARDLKAAHPQASDDQITGAVKASLKTKYRIDI